MTGRQTRATCSLGLAVTGAALVVLSPFRPSGFSSASRAFCGLSTPMARLRSSERRSGAQSSWIEVTPGPEVESSGGRVLPIFPAPSILWPEQPAAFGIIEPGHQKLYEDLLESGARQILSPLVQVPELICAEGAGPRQRPDRFLFRSLAAVLHLEDLHETSEQSGGSMKYAAKHRVAGRALIKRILNPSALFDLNEKQEKIDYLRVEVELLPEEEPLPEADEVAELAQKWQELRLLSQQLDEPRFQEDFVQSQHLAQYSDWRLSERWYRLRGQVQTHRDQARLSTAVNAWIQAEQEQGRLHATPSQALEEMPQELLEVVLRLNGPAGPKFENAFYDPFFRLLGSQSSKSRRELLLEMAEEEMLVLRARLSLKNIL